MYEDGSRMSVQNMLEENSEQLSNDVQVKKNRIQTCVIVIMKQMRFK